MKQNNVRVEMPVAIVEKNIAKKGELYKKVAEDFITFLYTPEAQREFARWGFRPVDKAIAKEFEAKLPPVKVRCGKSVTQNAHNILLLCLSVLR